MESTALAVGGREIMEIRVEKKKTQVGKGLESVKWMFKPRFLLEKFE